MRNEQTVRLLNGGDDRNARPLLPLEKEVMVEILQPVSTAAFIGISTSLVQAGQGLPDDMNVQGRSFLNLVLFAFFPIGLASLIASVAVKKRPQLIGWASGWLLFEFYFVTIIGGVVSAVKTDTNPWVAVVVTPILLGVTTFLWCHCCSYPKCLRRMLCCGRCGRNNDAENTSPSICDTCSSPRDQNGRAVVLAAQNQLACDICGGVVVPNPTV